MNKRTKFYLFVLFIVFSLLVTVSSGYFGLSQRSIFAFISMNRTLVVFIYIILFSVLATFSFSMTSIMTSLGALFFSIFEAVVFSLIAIMISSSIDFFISRKLGKDYVRSYLEKRGGTLESFNRVLEKDAFKTILILNAIFSVPPFVPNLLGGIMEIDFKKYFIATLLGNIPNTFFTVYFINGLFYSNLLHVYLSIAGVVLVALVSLYFYKGEIKDILKISFPRIFS